MQVEFSKRAEFRLQQIAEYLLRQGLSREFVLQYMGRIEHWLTHTLSVFPESGRVASEFGEGVRKAV